MPETKRTWMYLQRPAISRECTWMRFRDLTKMQFQDLTKMQFQDLTKMQFQDLTKRDLHHKTNPMFKIKRTNLPIMKFCNQSHYMQSQSQMRFFIITFLITNRNH